MIVVFAFAFVCVVCECACVCEYVIICTMRHLWEGFLCLLAMRRRCFRPRRQCGGFCLCVHVMCASHACVG